MYESEWADHPMLRVKGRRLLARDLIGLELERTDGARLPDWTAGAHIDLILGDGVTRQYSLTGDPRNPYSFHVGVLREPEGRGGSKYVHDHIKVGDEIGFGGPRNNFGLVPSQRYKFIAGGVGITPLIAMLTQATLLGADWQLLYLGRERPTMAYLRDLEAYGDRVTIHPSTQGRADLPRWLGPYRADTKIYVCGPDRLLNAVEAVTTDWRAGWVRMERFTARELDAPARTQPFVVELARSNVEVTVGADETVASAIRSAGVPILTSCGAGLCGTCETTVLAGEPDHRDSILDENERAGGRCMFPCVSRARSDRLVLEL